MPRARNPDAENLAPARPSSSHSAKPSAVAATPSAKPRLSSRAPRPASRDNLPARGPARPKRRALGDITNTRPPAPASAPAPAKPPPNQLPRPVPRDRFGTVDDPDVFPEPVPKVYEPPVLEFTDDELESIRPKDDGCDPLGRPLAQTVFEFPPQPAHLPPPFETGVDDDFDGLLDAEKVTLKWSKDEWLVVDDLQLAETEMP